MSNKLPWTRLFSSQWIVDVSGMSIVEKGLYMTLVLYMYEERRPIIEDAPKLARWAGCSVRILKKTLDILLRDEKIIRLDDGRLWSLKVEEELNNCSENLDKATEKASKAAKAAKLRWDKNKDNSDDDTHAMRNDAINNNNNNNINNIYKKNKTIVLSKKEIDFEDLETTDLVDEPIEGGDVESQSEQIATSSENQPPIHEQENVSKKAKRVKTDRGCRLPADFEPDYDFAIAEGLPPERIKVEIAKFRDYWNAKAGKDARKTDWQATWRNWVRNSKKYEINQQGGNNGKPSNQHTEQQRGWSYRVAQHMSNIKNSDSVYKFLFEDDNTTTIPLENRTKTIECRSGESYSIC
ncbi:DUF1376 domain-containing protein [Bartonella saheliensis]|uniref:DUF1376 domain-containing protein n=1 Tax=Bartonella saheliensis TaxID=1457016 RepID=UPI00119E4340|nr:DUF1376 domain-containing protein [Bartonella saheliensis]